MGASWKTSLQIAVIVLVLCTGAISALLVFPFSGLDAGLDHLSRGSLPPIFGRTQETAHVFRGGLVLACIVGLVLLSLCGMALGEIRNGAAEPASAAQDDAKPQTLAESMGLKLEIEVRALVELLRAHLAANTSYSASLSRAHQDLLSSVTAEEIKIIVKYLLVENEKMETKTANLEKSLERSRSQIDELRITLSEAQEIGLRDSLTTLCNRRYFDEALNREIAESKALGTELSLIIADIDHFKAINDKFGHLVGDEVLKLFGKLLSNNVKGRDTVARYGGEEFAIILPHTGIENAGRIAEQIRSQLEGNRWVLKQTKHWIGKITASFGIAQLAKEEGAERLIQRADERLYEAKSGGRNRVVADPATAKPHADNMALT
jgi:diguanylate cyclase